jgi:hypothetical protein
MLTRFELHSEIGRGALGVVYRATVKGLGLPVALRVIQDTIPLGTWRTRMHQVVPLLQSLNHPGIARLYDLKSSEDRLILVTEYVPGRSLRSWLDERGALPLQVVLNLFDQALAAVGAAHEHDLLHEDLRPEKFIVPANGRAKLVDIACAPLLAELGSRELADLGVNRLAYIAPERIRGDRVDSRADIYSLGAMLYELLSGEPPFLGSTLHVLKSHLDATPPSHRFVPEQLADVIRLAMAKDPADRPRSCSEFGGLVAAAGAAIPRVYFTSGRSPNGAWHGSEHAGCSQLGCDAAASARCEYQDETGRTCSSTWCADHVWRSEGGAFCRRHAAVVKSLERQGQSWLLMPRPALDDRGMALVARLGDELDDAIYEVLERRYRGSLDVDVIGDRRLRRIRAAADSGWERTWGAVKGDRWLHRVDLRVYASAPDRATVSLDGKPIFVATPDWIMRRVRRERPDAADAARFREKVLAAIQAAVDRSPLLTAPRS